IPGDVLTTFHLLSDYVLELLPQMQDPVVVAADLGFAKKGRNFAAKIDAPIAFIEKRRSGVEDAPAAMTIIGDVNQRDVIVVDDEVDTGGSVVEAVKMVKAHGARNVYLVFVHPVLSANAAARLAELPVTQIITTDTIPIPPEKRAILGDKLVVLSVAPLLAEVILRAHEGRSVGELFHE
ncbi:MAG: ribose-phosphate diphosphokinase, partial [candidate division WOR-3 bacterium]